MQMASWLRFYDGFYERCRMQQTILDIEIAQPWMVSSDVVVDAFMVWYDWKADQKAEERKTSDGHEANIPRTSDHPQVYKPAHR